MINGPTPCASWVAERSLARRRDDKRFATRGSCLLGHGPAARFTVSHERSPSHERPKGPETKRGFFKRALTEEKRAEKPELRENARSLPVRYLEEISSPTPARLMSACRKLGLALVRRTEKNRTAYGVDRRGGRGEYGKRMISFCGSRKFRGFKYWNAYLCGQTFI